MTVSEHLSGVRMQSERDLPSPDSPAQRRSLRWLLTIILAISLSTAALYYWRTTSNVAATALVKPRFVRPQIREANTNVLATGTMRLRTGAEVRVGAEISGIVTRLNVTVGSKIRKGDVIAEIESRGLSARIAQAKSQVEVDEAALRKVERDVARSRQLSEAQLIARQQTEDLEQDQAGAQARLAKSRSDLTVVESDLPYLTIRAPIAGTVASVSTQQGETVAAAFNAPTFITIIEDNALELVAMIDETDIGNVRPSDPVLFTTETFPAREFRGVVQRVAPKATLISGVVNYETSIRIEPEANVLKPDMTASVSISTALRKALMVPAEALHQKGEVWFVYISRNGVPQKREVSAGQRYGSWTQVNKGVEPGDVLFAGDVPAVRGGPR